MARKSAAERRAALRRRQQQAIKDRDKTGLGSKSILDFSKIEELNFFKPSSGKNRNLIDIIPYEITQEWYKDLRGPSGRATGMEVGEVDYKLEIPVHRSIGVDNMPVLCLQKAFGKKCPICEDLAEEYDKEESEQDQKKIRALSPSWRDFYNVFDLNDEEKGLQIWANQSYHLFEKFLLEAAEEEMVTFSDLEEGATINVKFREKSLRKQSFLEASDISFEERDEGYDDDILDDSISLDALLHIPTYEEVTNIYLGLDMDENNSNKEDEKEPPKRFRKSSDEEKKPKRRIKRRKPKPKDDAPPEDIEEKQEEPDTKDENDDSTSKDEAPFDTCPAGGKFGVDCGKLDECDDCDDETFEACAAEEIRLRKEKRQK